MSARNTSSGPVMLNDAAILSNRHTMILRLNYARFQRVNSCWLLLDIVEFSVDTTGNGAEKKSVIKTACHRSAA